MIIISDRQISPVDETSQVTVRPLHATTCKRPQQEGDSNHVLTGRVRFGKKYIYQRAHKGKEETPINKLWYNSRDFVAFREAFLYDAKVVAKQAKVKSIDRALHQIMKFSWRNLDYGLHQLELQEIQAFLRNPAHCGLASFFSKKIYREKTTSKQSVVDEVLNTQSMRSSNKDIRAMTIRHSSELVSEPSRNFAHFVAVHSLSRPKSVTLSF